MNDIISIIIPLYNKRNSIAQSISSILNQNYENFEIIVVDDGSNDNSDKIVQSFKDERIKYIFKQNGGVSSARNRGLAESNGNWILFLDADDILLPECLTTLISPLKDLPDIQISSANFDIVEGNISKPGCMGNINGIIRNNYKSFFYQEFSLRAGNFIIRRELALKYLYSECLTRFEDLKVILQYIRNAKIYNSMKSVMAYRKQYSKLSKLSNNCQCDYTFHLSFRNKSFWEKCNLGKLIYLGWIGYKEHHKDLLEIYHTNILWGIIARILMILSKLGIKL